MVFIKWSHCDVICIIQLSSICKIEAICHPSCFSRQLSAISPSNDYRVWFQTKTFRLPEEDVGTATDCRLIGQDHATRTLNKLVTWHTLSYLAYLSHSSNTQTKFSSFAPFVTRFLKTFQKKQSRCCGSFFIHQCVFIGCKFRLFSHKTKARSLKHF